MSLCVCDQLSAFVIWSGLTVWLNCYLIMLYNSRQ